VPRRTSKQLLIGDALSNNGWHRSHEAALIIILSSIEQERLLIEIAEQVERLETHIGALNPALQEAPEVWVKYINAGQSCWV